MTVSQAGQLKQTDICCFKLKVQNQDVLSGGLRVEESDPHLSSWFIES